MKLVVISLVKALLMMLQPSFPCLRQTRCNLSYACFIDCGKCLSKYETKLKLICNKLANVVVNINIIEVVFVILKNRSENRVILSKGVFKREQRLQNKPSLK